MDRTTSENIGSLPPVAAAQISAIEPLKGHPPPLPEKPIVTIEPRRSWVALDLRDLWAYRELLYFLTWRDVKVRYKQTALGAIWAVLQPLLTMAIFTIVFGRLAGINTQTGGVPYPIFAYAGVLPWTFFANAISNSSNSLVGSANLITKVYFPRMLVPAAAIGAGLVDFGIAFVTLAALILYYRIGVSWSILALPLLVLLTATLALAFGLWLSALNVKYRDIRHALPFFIQLGMFMSPVIYPSSAVPAKWRWVLAINPLTGIIEAFRAALFNQPFDLWALTYSIGMTVALLVYSAYSFKRMEKRFADIV